MTLDSFTSIADGICQLDVIDCKKLGGMDLPESKVKGITFFQEGWNTVVAYEKC